MYLTSVLSVSKKEKINCEEIAKYLSQLGKITLITSTISTHPEIEYGCQITQPIMSKEDIKHTWEKLRDRYKFKCGHININIDLSRKYNGCILDYLYK